jgi:hypothetical protein
MVYPLLTVSLTAVAAIRPERFTAFAANLIGSFS